VNMSKQQIEYISNLLLCYLKTLCCMQEAAGVFVALQGEAAKVLAPQPDDLSPACVTALTKLMLVQVYRCG